MKVSRPEVRAFYEFECIKAGWTVRELERQIGSFLFERLARSRDKDGVLALAREGHEIYRPSDLVKDPYVLEFTGLPESSHWLESDLEAALIADLQHFLLELGRDLHFVWRVQADHDGHHRARAAGNPTVVAARGTRQVPVVVREVSDEKKSEPLHEYWLAAEERRSHKR